MNLQKGLNPSLLKAPALVCLVAGLFFSMFHAVAFLRLDSGLDMVDEDPPGIYGPDRVCLTTGNKIENYSGGGNANTDTYQWIVKGPTGAELRNVTGAFQDFPFTFSIPGQHTLTLIVTRGESVLIRDDKKVIVTPAPTIFLRENYVLCAVQELDLIALDPSTPDLGSYNFEWSDGTGKVIGKNNQLTVAAEGNYTVTFFYINALAERECTNQLTTQVSFSANFKIDLNGTSFCPANLIEAKPSASLFGSWFYQKDGGDKKYVRDGENLNMSVDELEGLGNYTLFFEVINNNNPECQVVQRTRFTYAPNPAFTIEEIKSASTCGSNDGVLRVTATTAIDNIYYVIDDETTSAGFAMAAGQSLDFRNLASGVYKFEGYLNGCRYVLGGLVNLENIPPNLNYQIDLDEIVPEICTEDGKTPGKFTIRFQAAPVDVVYELFTERGELAGVGVLKDETETVFDIELVGGIYLFEIYQPIVIVEEDEDGVVTTIIPERCLAPFVQEIEIPGLPQVEFQVPQEFNICGEYELTPFTNQNLEFTLINLADNSRETGQSFIMKQGDYELVGKHLDLPEEVCPRMVPIKVGGVDPVEYNVIFKDQDCLGNQNWEVDILNKELEEVTIAWYDESGEVISVGVEMSPTTYGKYQIDIQPLNILGSCPNPPQEFDVPPPVFSVPVVLEASPLCPYGPDARITLDTEFDEIGTIKWRLFDEEGDFEELEAFQNQRNIEVTEPGVYQVIVFNKFNETCDIGTENIRVRMSESLTDFTVPQELITVCERYSWIPDSNEPLIFTLTYPNKEEVIRSSDEFFVLNQSGEYTIRGESADVNNPICPNVKSFEVKVVKQIDFTPKLVNETCEGEFTYEAVLKNSAPDEVLFYWYDESGSLIHEEQTFITNEPGSYALEVQPKGSMRCDINPTAFEIEKPVVAIDFKLNASSLCPEADFATITIDTDLTGVARIEWYYTAIDGAVTLLSNYTDALTIEAQNEGVYEARLINKLECELGKDRVLIMRSMDDVRPVVKETYEICSEYEIGETIDPGVFSRYSWLFNEEEVSNRPAFKPQVPGVYVLKVYSGEGCEYITTFDVIEECELKIMVPTALRPGDTERNFLVYSNYLVDVIDIWVFNKWGQTIFQCSTTNLGAGESACAWDGYVNGEKIPNGSYGIRIYYKNIEANIEKNIRSAITVID